MRRGEQMNFRRTVVGGAISVSFFTAHAAAQDVGPTELSLRGLNRTSVALTFNSEAAAWVGADSLAMRVQAESLLTRAGIHVASRSTDTTLSILLLQVRTRRSASDRVSGLNADCQTLLWVRAPSHPPVGLWAATWESQTATGVVSDKWAKSTISNTVGSLVQQFIEAWRTAQVRSVPR
jgi:hypothetical protein